MKAKYKELKMMLETLGASEELKEELLVLVNKLGDFEQYLVDKEGITPEGVEKIYETFVQVEMNKKVAAMEEDKILEFFSGKDSSQTKVMIKKLSFEFANKYEYEKAEEFGEAAAGLITIIEKMGGSLESGGGL